MLSAAVEHALVVEPGLKSLMLGAAEGRAEEKQSSRRQRARVVPDKDSGGDLRKGHRSAMEAPLASGEVLPPPGAGEGAVLPGEALCPLPEDLLDGAPGPQISSTTQEAVQSVDGSPAVVRL
jgi:hypothetical protein